MAVRETAKVAEWRERLRRFDSAGVSIAKFCREEGVSQSSFYLWRMRLECEASSRAEFAPLRIVGGERVRVSLPGGALIEVPRGDERVIRIVMEALLSVRGESC